MRIRLVIGLLAILGTLSIGSLTGCSGFTLSSPTPLPTLVLDGGTPSQNESQSTFAGSVTASGVAVPARQAQLVFGLAGTVLEVNVAVGDTVKAGQVLATLAGREKLAAAVEATNYELLSAQQALKTLEDNADSQKITAQLRLANAQKALDDAQKRRNWKQYRNGSQSTIETAQADLILAEDALEKAEDAYADVANRAENDVLRAAALSALGAARKARDRAQANLNYLLAMPNEIDVNQVEAELLSAQAEVADAQKEVDQLKDGPDPDTLALAQARIQNAQAQVAASQSALANLELTAPFDGTVSQVYITNGEWTLPGQPVLELVDLANMRVETTDLSERDVPNVQIGQTVTVLVEPLNVDIPGRVVQISPLADTRGGDVVYKTTIELETIPVGLRAGMSVVVRFDGTE